MRSCGDGGSSCDACCTLLAITEIDKPTLTRCPHQNPADHGGTAGCSIYPSRPRSCAGWSCLWLQGHGDGVQDRPDRCGVMFDSRKLGGIVQVFASEVVAGAFLTDAAQAAMGRMVDSLDQGLLLCRRSDVQTPVGMYGRDHHVRRLIEQTDMEASVAEAGMGADLAGTVIRNPQGEAVQ